MSGTSGGEHDVDSSNRPVDPAESDLERGSEAEADQPRSAHPRRRIWRRAYQALAVGTALLFLPIAIVRISSSGYVDTVAQVPAEPVGIVFGASEVNDEPSPYLASRLDTAITLWHAHKIKVFLVTGDNSRPDYNEPKAMHDYLVAHGVPSAIIVMDYAGFDTWQSCVRAKKVFGVEQAIVISQSFHVPRAVMLCRAAGIEAYGVGDGAAAWSLGHGEYIRDETREVAAAFNALYQAAFTPAPTFLGPADPGIADALRAATS
jgi:vancomycin permeability regulator SanA